MANTLKLKRSSVAGKVPATTDLQLSEMAINTTDGRLYSKKNVASVDSIVEYLNTDSAFKTNVICATTANITLSGTQTIDGIAVVANDRVLVKNQSTPASNGIYVVAAGAWSRAADADAAIDVAGAIVGVSSGTTNGGAIFYTGFKSSNALGTDAMNWTQLVGGTGASLSAANVFTNTNTFTDQVSVGDGTTFVGFRLAGPAGVSRYMRIRTGSIARWDIGANSGAESGSNAGTDFAINRYDDAGTYVDTPLFIQRANGAVSFTFLESGTKVGTANGSSQWLNINGSAGNSRAIYYQTAGVDRWRTRASSTAETGSDAGSNFAIESYTDAGVFKATPFSIDRASGVTTITDLNVSNYIRSGVDVGTNDGTYVSLDINGSAAFGRMLRYRTAGVTRWEIGADNSAESGSNAGSNYDINRYSDAGSYIDTPFTILRDTGLARINLDPGSRFGSDTTANAYVVINAVAGGQKAFIFKTANVNRWLFGADYSETGSDAGADFAAYSYTDAGAYKEAPFIITRATGVTYMKQAQLGNDLAVIYGGTGASTGSAALANLDGGARVSVASAGTTTTLTVSSPRRLLITGTLAHTVQMPDVTTLALGAYWEISNSSTQSITVTSSGGNTIVTVSPSVTVRVECILITGTTNASWEWIVAGNWQGWLGSGRFVLANSPTITTPTFSTSATLSSTDAGASFGPIFNLFRDSASPAAADAIGMLQFTGRDSAAAIQEYASIYALINDPTAGADDADLIFRTVVGGTVAERARISQGRLSINAYDASIGGQLTLQIPTSTILNGNVDLSLQSDRIYFQENVSPFRGAYLDIAGNASGSRILTSTDTASGYVRTPFWIKLASNYTLTSTTAAQKLFNTTTNGALTLATGTYEFEAVYYILSMSATSGNASVSILGAGTATLTGIMQHAIGLDNTTPTTAAAHGGSVSVNPGVNTATAGTGTGLVVSVRGTFRVTVSGTIIPSITLATAAAAIVQAGSYFKCAKIGESGDNTKGSWS